MWCPTASPGVNLHPGAPCVCGGMVGTTSEGHLTSKQPTLTEYLLYAMLIPCVDF